ncbi:glycosyltransferase family 4 protein [Acidipropionibacterium jensenii]|uniref:GDP-mannose-dependent alpha-mannosyltransferase n=3 Tax=Acidipropionibacterium jensenii TaxID=1749 RepID=A0A3S4UZ94_9ACTN|nr:glycosyltransferase family 1 protein [Acidipropionibacterium jensenii]MDN5977359.1 glycosyltransferase family 1 protein [Acidipropionibacterium jensenii]MDN5995858.1 glycosyltransferase family 1 protein [Acidipropionibacterium jensenii]MDN6021202.1 glycosyltransferase family 1 protein [Acidipropionibacterium jensenii]MDN6427884.1 glycosyltransferase family 1 protein [Acidipropionibacterium jensenii]MDN6440638.1 glycosyltransferase family 1 protein [Acidipropionibacterium jensenii]
MRVAIISESFLPQVNGVTNSILRVLEYLRAHGHQAVVLAPGDPAVAPKEYAGFPVLTLSSVTWPGYQDVRVSTTPQWTLERYLNEFSPDVVHLASPFMIGYKGALAAATLGIPAIAIYQTDIPSYAARYGIGHLEFYGWYRVRQIHSLMVATYAPSTYSRDQLVAHGVPRVGIWGRGVDKVRFNPAKRSQALHDQWAPRGETVIGYMGRLASEKRVEDMIHLVGIPGTRIVIVGHGPQRESLEKEMPDAVFCGGLYGEDLPRALASMDVFCSTGELETFCQAVQEAKASGLPVVSPRRGGPIDLIDPSRTGWLYEPGNMTEFRERVTDLVGDPFKREAMGRAARASIEDRTWDHLCAELMDHYREAIRLGSLAAARSDDRSNA